MKPNKTKLRIVGSTVNCERILSLLKLEAKIWGGRRLWKVRKFDRDPNSNPYSHIFGTSEMAVYVEMTMKDRKK